MSSNEASEAGASSDGRGSSFSGRVADGTSRSDVLIFVLSEVDDVARLLRNSRRDWPVAESLPSVPRTLLKGASSLIHH